MLPGDTSITGTEVAAVVASFLAAATAAASAWHFLGHEVKRRLGWPEGTLLAAGLSLLTMGAAWVLSIWVLIRVGALPPTGDTGFPWWALLVGVAILGSLIYTSAGIRAKT